ncbi:Cytoplasmic tRNA 2-thiolation protein 2 [Mortierella polycephala]|uniref:Cytoplasmic tRNA 2-thiolation protein 2 n=1 Tax=Mortierella polycephala TaxID=41804 RepID=A0A9P6TY80_9FUNG|nr:Cytoplasmic tRNA 2-thiolation protein 2 [Mortierella polycephala]
MEQAQSIAAGYGYSFHGASIEDIYDPEWSDSQCFEAVASLVTSLPKEQLATSGQAPELLTKVIPLRTSTSTSMSAPDNTEETLASPITSVRSKLSRTEKISKLKALLGACTTLTAKETILQHFRSSLLVQLTKRAQCTILALGDSATMVAVQIIGLTASGRGYSLPHETSLLSNWIQDCKIIRPLKDCLVKELDTFCRLNDLELIEKHSAQLDWTMRTKAEVKSINRLTKEFITGLDKEFPSTVATVCRTAAKLTAPEATYENKCPLCHGPVQKDVQEWKSRITVMTAPSDNANNNPPSKPAEADGCCSSNGSGCCSGNSAATCSQPPQQQSHDTAATLPFSSLLCYGCLTNLRDLDLKTVGNQTGDDTSSFELPPYVAESILDRMGFPSLESFQEQQESTARARAAEMDPRESLREQIQEFLIASDDEDDEGDEA